MDNKTITKHICPNCGASFYRVDYQTTTAMFCPMIIKDVARNYQAGNSTTTHCTCMNCGVKFSFSD